MRILHVAQPVDAGVPQVVVDLVTEQVRRGWDVVVACPDDGWLPRSARLAGGQVVPWAASRSPGLSVVRETWAIAALVRQVTPSVVHLHSAKAGLAGRLAVRGRVPTVFQPHAWSFEAVDGVMGRVTRWWERVAARWTHLIVTVSEAEAARGRTAGVMAPTTVVPNGVDVTRWAPQDRAAARASLGLPDVPTAVCVGRLTRQKGQDLLLGAWSAVRDQVPDAQLILVGDGPDRLRLELAAVAGVRFAGHQDDPAPWYAAADVVVMPSRWEGMALVPLEAMAASRSVVATDVAGGREAMGQLTGAVVPIDDRAALAEAVSARLADPELAVREGARGRTRVTEQFDVLRSTAAVSDATRALVLEEPRGGIDGRMAGQGTGLRG
ncbi:glycosyltransferase [Blastococcus sp. SYSU DS0973]